MGTIGYGYGSEWHLLRHLGYHRAYLSQKVLKVIDGTSIDWLDFEFSRENKPLKDDREFLGLEFTQNVEIQEMWEGFWAPTRNSQNWDAVGKIYFGNQVEWLLVEAKSHINEIMSECGATSKISQQRIRSALKKTSLTFGNHSQPVENWLKPYYQFANRLAALHFLLRECRPSIPARLLFICFYGENREILDCPKSEQDWLPVINRMKDWLGIDKDSEISQRVHYLYLPVNPVGKDLRPVTKGR